MQIRKQGTHPKIKTKYDLQQQISKKRDVFDYLGRNPKEDMQSDKLKLRLIREGMLKPKCDDCDRSQWRDEAITLELDHIDGNKSNNHHTNLREVTYKKNTTAYHSLKDEKNGIISDEEVSEKNSYKLENFYSE